MSLIVNAVDMSTVKLCVMIFCGCELDKAILVDKIRSKLPITATDKKHRSLCGKKRQFKFYISND